MTPTEIVEMILKERLLQDGRFGAPKERGYTPEQWLTVLVEEVGEVAAEIQMLPIRPSPPLQTKRLTGELIQVAAVAFAMIEAFKE